MIFAAGCGGGAPAPKDETPSAIKPVENEEKVTLYDRTMSQSLTLTRVTTDSRKDASELYMIIREYLDGCYYDDSLTVISCNDRLRANGEPTLTKLTSEKEDEQ